MPRRQTPRLSEALVEYETVRSSRLARSTLQNDHSVLNRFIAGVGDPRCHLLSARAVELYFAGEATRQAASSYNKVRMRVGLFVKFMQRRGWLEADPLAEVGPRRVEKRERLRLTETELAALVYEAPRARDRAFLAVAANTALRASDLTALRLRDVDLEAGVIHVVMQKTKQADDLPITAELDLELRRWLRIYAETVAEQSRRERIVQDLAPIPHRRITKLTPDSFLLPPYHNEGNPKATSVYPDRKMTHTERVVHSALRRLGHEETKGEGVHTLRRSTARLLFEAASAEGHDAALRITGALLGHQSTVTTEGYLGLSLDRQKRDALLKGRSFLKPTPPSGSAIVVALREASSGA